MKRRFTAAAVLIGILLVGVITTVVTSNFVSSQAEKITTDSVVSRNDPDTPENIILSRNESNIGMPSARPQVSSNETVEDADISETDNDDTTGSPDETEESVPVNRSVLSAAEETGRETENDLSSGETEDEAEGSDADNDMSIQTQNGPSIYENTGNESILSNSSDDTVLSEIGSSGPGDYISISPLDTTAADNENEITVSDPGNGNVTTVGESTPAETVRSPLESASSQPVDQNVASIEDLKARLASVEEKTSDQGSSDSLSPQAAEYELNLWNYEMNYIADTLRRAMDYDSAESLLQEQLKFLKDRDLAYESGAMENRAQNESDTSYITEAAEKTRQQCYYLLDTYGDILE